MTDVSICINTFFDKYKLTYQKIILLIETIANNLTCIIFAKIYLEISQKTVVNWYCCTREINTFFLFQGDLHIGRPDLTV